ncbi:MAG: hypothetical protein HC896_00405 [Bacteroidales bacterium]|nr:hypothetical protein [Bacteroidales bacterium]
MAYNQVNHLRKVLEIQEITKIETERGVTQIWVYKHRIKEIYFISYSTFCNYMGIPAKAKLKALGEEV